MAKLSSSQWRRLSLVPIALIVVLGIFGKELDDKSLGILSLPRIILLGAIFYCLRRGMDVDRKPTATRAAGSVEKTDSKAV